MMNFRTKITIFLLFYIFFCCDEETSNYTPIKVQAFVKTSLIDKKGFLWWFIKLWRQPALQTKYVNGTGYTYFCKECDSFYIVKRFLILNTFEAWYMYYFVIHLYFSYTEITNWMGPMDWRQKIQNSQPPFIRENSTDSVAYINRSRCTVEPFVYEKKIGCFFFATNRSTISIIKINAQFLTFYW